MAAVTISSDFGAQNYHTKIKYVTVSIVSLSICHEVMGPDYMILVFWSNVIVSLIIIIASTYTVQI